MYLKLKNAYIKENYNGAFSIYGALKTGPVKRCNCHLKQNI
jgi:hypothetical protein